MATLLQPPHLDLPDVQILPSCSVNCEFYGASFVSARHFGFDHPPTIPRGYWTHGWSPKQWIEFDDPMLVYGVVDLKGKNDYYWVGRRDEEDLMLRHGYNNVKAIGLPIIYV